MGVRIEKGPVLFDSARMRFRTVALVVPGGARVTRGLIEHPGSVVVLPVTNEGQVVMIRNQRWTVGQELLELPAGTMAWGENPAEAADRELVEETGYQAERLAELVDFYAAPGSSNEHMHGFVATGLRHLGQRLEADEDIAVQLVEKAEIPGLLRSGRIKDAKTLAMLGRWWLDHGDHTT